MRAGPPKKREPAGKRNAAFVERLLKAFESVRGKINPDDLSDMLLANAQREKAALEAKAKVGLKLNVERAVLQSVLEALPALRNPTISSLSDEEWVAVETVIEKRVAREIIPTLKRLGSEGIVEYPLNKLVP